MPISTLEGYPRIGGVIGYGPVGGSGVWKLQERYALVDDFYDNVSLLLKMNGANGSTTFLDSSQFGHAVTANGDAQISTTESKFGGSSAAFDGTGDYLTTPAGSTVKFGTGDFTIEMFIRPSTVNTSGNTTGLACLLDNDVAQGLTGSWFALHQNNQALVLAFNNANQITTTNCLSAATWHHVCVVRSGSTATVYCDGVSVGSVSPVTYDFSDATSRTLSVAAQFGSSRDFAGYIDSLRITKGQARYTAAFTPPQRDFLP
jgi:hypothetical protein